MGRRTAPEDGRSTESPSASPETLHPEPVLLAAGSGETPDRRSSCEDLRPAAEGPAALFEATLRLKQRGCHEQVLENLEKLKEAMPRLTDYFAMMEGDTHMALEPNERACEAYEEARRSPLRSIVARSRVAQVRCLLTIGDRRAAKALSDLRKRYPQLPQLLELRLLHAYSREREGAVSEAIATYRDIDMLHPGSEVAREARRRREDLAQEGVNVGELSLFQRITRLEQLARTGPLDVAEEEIEALRATKLARRSMAQIAEVAADIARRQGRFEEARELYREANATEELASMESASTPVDPERAKRNIRSLTGGRSLLREPPARLALLIQMAARADMKEEVDRALDAMLQRRNLPARFKFNAAIAASGVGDDELLARLFTSLQSSRPLELESTYHLARSLERLEHFRRARAEYQRVIELDNGPTTFYAVLARQRLPIVTAHVLQDCLERRNESSEIPMFDGDEECFELERELAVMETPPEPSPEPPQRSGPAIAEDLRPFAENHGEAFPWLHRAVDLLTLDRKQEAADELHETFLAWYDARGRSPLRTGVVSVYRGTYLPRHLAPSKIRRVRRQLSTSEMTYLADISAEIGDHGLSVRLGGWSRANERPRAYLHLVEQSAARHGVDPDLLHAVMRVESVYNPRIISYAGAIGLNQIMPRTGNFIARQLHRDDFTVEDLLDPATNIEFSAWYLASLVERFDGRIPLAVAAYNGGPHNVRLWIEQRPNMTLEAFCETIPFGQTHRYVRRVLTHYEAYRNLRGRFVDPMDLTLPEVEPDPLAF